MVIQFQINDGLMTKTRTYDKIYRGAGLAELEEQFFNHRAYSKWGQMVQLKGKETIVLHTFGKIPDDVKVLKTPKIDIKMDEEMTGLLAQMQEIGNELAHQDNLHTAWPIWYVTEIKKIYTTVEGEWEFQERMDPDILDEDELCTSCSELNEDGKDLPETCDKCGNAAFAYYNEERQFTSYGSEFFLTQKACQEYIDANSYHFNDPKPYAGSAFRNHEIQPIIQFLIKLSGNKVPSNHYGGSR